MVDGDGNCFVKELTIGREDYGSVFFFGIVNVAGLDLDSIGEAKLVLFKKKKCTQLVSVLQNILFLVEICPVLSV